MVPPHCSSTTVTSNGTTISSSTKPIISITTEDLSPDRSRRPSTHSLGPFSVSGLTDFLQRGTNPNDRNSSYASRRPSMIGILPVSPAESRRPSTHSVGFLPISMFGEGSEKPRRPSTHSLGVFPFGCFGEDKPERPRRCSTHSLGPLVVPVSFEYPQPSSHSFSMFLVGVIFFTNPKTVNCFVSCPHSVIVYSLSGLAVPKASVLTSQDMTMTDHVVIQIL